MEWNTILREYEQTRAIVAQKLESEPAAEDRGLFRDIHRQMTDDIRQVRKNSLRELKDFLDIHGEEVLTKRQREVLSLRAQGKSLGRIAGELGVSKTAIQQSIRLSERKIRAFMQAEEEGGCGSHVS